MLDQMTYSADDVPMILKQLRRRSAMVARRRRQQLPRVRVALELWGPRGQLTLLAIQQGQRPAP